MRVWISWFTLTISVSAALFDDSIWL